MRLGCSPLQKLLGAPVTLTPTSSLLSPQGRFLLIILCSLGFSAAYILLCCWAYLPFCLISCLGPHLATNSRPTVPGPLHFSGYSRVPDGKVSRPDSMLEADQRCWGIVGTGLMPGQPGSRLGSSAY